ncbi:hypothetical protein MRX96_006502 [Rhipicephalus microplus]
MKPRAPSRHHHCPRLTCVSAEDVASLNTQSFPSSTGPEVLECGQMQEIKIAKRSVSKNNTLSDLRMASVAAAASAELKELEAWQLKDGSVQMDTASQMRELFCCCCSGGTSDIIDVSICTEPSFSCRASSSFSSALGAAATLDVLRSDNVVFLLTDLDFCIWPHSSNAGQVDGGND